MEIIARGDKNDAFADGARALLGALEGVEDEHIVLALPGGRSISAFLTQLRTLFPSLDEDVRSRVHVVLLDERCVGETSSERNWSSIEESFTKPLIAAGILESEQCHPFYYDERSPESSVREYSSMLTTLGGKIHIAVASAGEDGHIASLFPNHPSVESERTGYILVSNSPKPPPLRISASAALLSECDSVVLLFMGEGKKDALTGFMKGAVPIECPASLAREAKGCIVITDILS